MDVFVLDSEFNASENVSGIRKSLWVERYNKYGEFKFVGDPLKLREKLPEGTLVTHTKTDSVMMVETHIIEEESNKTAELVILGRTIDVIAMENRSITGNDVSWSSQSINGVDHEVSSDKMIYDLTLQNGWAQAILLLKNYLTENEFSDENIPNLFIPAFTSSGIHELLQIPRRIKIPSNLASAVYKILQSSGCGIKVERPSPERIDDLSDPSPDDNLYFTIHVGVDLSSGVTFDYGSGDLKKARYIWSNRNKKSGFYSFAKGVTTRYLSEGTGLYARMATIDATDIDLEPDLSPDDIAPYTSGRGFEEIHSPDEGLIVDALGSNTAGPKYNRDYKIGDVVMVLGNYGVVNKMRVVEHAITSDDTGDNSIPTLAPIVEFGFSSG